MAKTVLVVVQRTLSVSRQVPWAFSFYGMF